jgi:stress response protein SCP2
MEMCTGWSRTVVTRSLINSIADMKKYRCRLCESSTSLEMHETERAEGRKCAKICFEFVDDNLKWKTDAVGDVFTLVDVYMYM